MTDYSPSNVTPIGDPAATPDPALIENLRKLLTMAETGQLRWFYGVGQTANRCQVVHSGGEPVDPRGAFYALDSATDAMKRKTFE